jgi:hypothetical protein
MARPYTYSPRTSYDPLERMLIIGVVILVPLIIIGSIIVALMATPDPNDIDVTPLTPQGSLRFDDLQSVGEYNGYFTTLSEEVRLEDVELMIMDDSLLTTAILEPLVDGGTAEVSGGMNCTFFDSDGDGRLSLPDTFRIFNGASGDEIRIIYLPTMIEIDRSTLE